LEEEENDNDDEGLASTLVKVSVHAYEASMVGTSLIDVRIESELFSHSANQGGVNMSDE